MKNIVTCFTKEEKEHIKELCDFTPTEETLFDLRKKEKSLEECAEIMHVSTKTAGRINVKMQHKILRVTFLCPFNEVLLGWFNCVVNNKMKIEREVYYVRVSEI